NRGEGGVPEVLAVPPDRGRLGECALNRGCVACHRQHNWREVIRLDEAELLGGRAQGRKILSHLRRGLDGRDRGGDVDDDDDAERVARRLPDRANREPMDWYPVLDDVNVRALQRGDSLPGNKQSALGELDSSRLRDLYRRGARGRAQRE